MDNHEEDDAEEIKHSVFKRQKKGISTGTVVLSILFISNLYNFYVIITLQGVTLPFEFLFSFIAFAFITLIVAIYYIKKESPRGMNNNDDVLHQSEPFNLKEKRWSPHWATFLSIISALLIIAHVIFLGYLLYKITEYGSGYGFIGTINLILFAIMGVDFLVLWIIDFVVIFVYIITQKPEGIAETISHIALTIVGLMLFYSGIAVMSIYF
jgi:hypothetical protein